MGEADIRIESLLTIERFHECESLQQRVWGLEGLDVVPLHLMITMQRSGGLVLGAFDDAGHMIGFLLGFLGAHGGDVRRPKHCSHMMGVLDAWRGRGVGARLKLAQREHALSQGLDLVTWTFDPLESLNAALNIGKLGAVCRTYLRDLYGPMTDGLNAGLSSDRFQVDWWIRSRHVSRRLDERRERPSLDAVLGDAETIVQPATVRGDGRLEPTVTALHLDRERVAVEIPAEIQTIKETDRGLALRWRARTREIFETCFAAGYSVVDFVSGSTGTVRRSYYVLAREVEEIGCGSSESS